MLNKIKPTWILPTLLSVFLFFSISSATIFSQNKDCPSCPKKEEKKQDPNQPQPKEYLVGDLKVIEIPSKYSQEELEKMFPVPEQWKEWYRLEKEGILPKYVKIIDIYQSEINNCKLKNKSFGEDKQCIVDMDTIADNLLDHKNKSDHLDIEWYKNKITEGGGSGCIVLAEIISEKNHTYYQLIPLLLKCLKEDPLYASNLGQSIINILYYYKCNPGFYEKTINNLKEYIPVFWEILNNANKYSDNKKVIYWIQSTAIDALYLLDENIDKIIKNIQDNQISVYPSSYSFNYLDVVNHRRIEYVDYRLSILFNTILSEADPINQYLAINYFIKMDCYEEYIDTIVKFCINNFNSNGIQIFKRITIKNNNIIKMKKLAEYLYLNVQKSDLNDYEKNSLTNFIKYNYNIPND